MANTPEESDHTSVQKRLTCEAAGNQPKQLLRFAGIPRQIMPKGLPFGLKSHHTIYARISWCSRQANFTSKLL